MAYVVKKPLNIAGRRREIGEVLQDDEVRSASVIRSGRVAYIGSENGSTGGSGAKGYICIQIGTGNGARDVNVATDGVCDAIATVQMAADDAVEAVKGITDIPTLEVIGAITSVKKVKAAAIERITVLNKEDHSEGGE